MRCRPPFARIALGVPFAAALVLAASRPGIAGERRGVQEFGAQIGYSQSNRSDAQVIPFQAHAAWLLPDWIDQPLARRNLNLKWVLEPWIAGVHATQSDSIEVGVNALTFKLDYDRGQTWVPFLFGGEGMLYTSLQGKGLSGPFEFSSSFGVGVHYFLTSDTALSFAARYRHISNAGIRDPNRGLDSGFLLVGFERFPNR